MRRHWWLIAILAVTSFPRVTAVDASSLSQRAPPFTGRELQRLVDRALPKDMAATHVPGAVFVAVKGGQILVARGYGYSNLARKTRVRARTTVFHLGPTSVVFTAAAAMKLAQEGRVALQAKVNRYLTAFKLAGTYRRPVTLADLLTNTGGFGDRHIGRMTYSASDVRPLGQYLATSMPPRMVPPGEEYSYRWNLLGYHY